MTVEQLIKKLSKIDPKTNVLMFSDMEGNNVGELSHVNNDNIGYKRRDREILLWDKSCVKEGEITQKEFDKMKKCVILVPNM